jgi:hypothetical protein
VEFPIMAKHPHQPDDKPFGKGPKTPQPKKPGPKTPVPQMSLDEPVEEVLEAAEVVEEAEPVEAEPLEAVEAELFADDDIESAEPVDEEVLSAEDAVEVTGSSAVLAEAEPVSATPSGTRASDVDLMALFDEKPIDSASPMSAEITPTPDPDADRRRQAEEEIAEAAPASDISEAEAIFEEAVAEPVSAVEEATPVSDVLAAEEIEEAAPVSDVASAVEAAEEVEEAAPVSDVLAAEEVAEAMPESAVEAMPESAVVAAEEVEEAAPVSDVLAEEFAEAMPESAVEVAEAAPASATVASAPAASEAAQAPAESAVVASSEAFAAPPESAVVASAESIAARDEAVPASGVKGEDVLFDEAIAEAAPASEVLSGEVVEEAAEIVEPSSATRRAEAVLDDEVAEAAEVVSGVEFDETAEAISATEAKDEEVLFAEEEAEEATPASAVDLGDMADVKGASGSGIDKIAEALESGEELEVGEAVPASMKDTAGSVEFDELLDDLGEETPTSKKKKTVGKLADEVTELDAEAAEAMEAEEDEVPIGKKDKKKAKATAATGDDVDLNDLFGDEEAKPAEAAEAFADEEPEAAVGEAAEEDVAKEETEKPAKKGKKAAVAEEAADEEPSTKKKKGKKDKEKATIAPAAGAGSGVVRILVGMVAATVLFVILGGGLLFVAPNQFANVAYMAGAEKPKAPTPPKERTETDLEKAHKAMDDGNYDEVISLLDDATGKAEVALRGEAKWLNHLKKNEPLAKGTLDDLKDHPLYKQIGGQLNAGTREKDLTDQLAKANAAIGSVAKQLTAAKGELEKANTDLANANAANAAATKQLTTSKADLAKALTANGDLMKQLIAATDGKTKAESLVDSVADVLVKGKLIQNKAELDAALLGKIIQGLNDDRTALALAVKNAKDAEVARADAVKNRDALQKTINDAFKQVVAAKITIDPKDDPLKNKLLAELVFFRGREPFVESPQQKLNTYIALLQDRNLNNPKKLEDISREADWVLSPDNKSDADSRGKARYVQGLALRNQERFAEARAAFDEAIKIAKGTGKATAWAAAAGTSLNELTDPRAYYVPRIERLRDDGKYGDAADEAAAALKAMPNEAIFNLQRGLAQLETIKGKGPKIADETQKAIRADVDAAGKDAKLAAEAAYVAGLLEEELHNFKEAEDQIRAAIKLHDAAKGSEDDAGKYRIALSRLLLRDRDAVAPAPPAEEKKKDDKGASVPPVEERVIVMHPWTPLVVCAVIAQDQPDDPVTARLKEAIEEANKLIASKNDKLRGEGYLALGKALTRMGQRTEGLRAYAEGLRLLHKGISGKELQQMIDEHPAFQQPDVSDTPNPVMSERHFSEGLHMYWAGQYVQAEMQFRQAVKFYNKDARYYYYLGMAQIGQKTNAKRSAGIYSFEQGARLEAQNASTNPLVVRDINASLERVQGELRQTLNSYRYKAAGGTTEPEAK